MAMTASDRTAGTRAPRPPGDVIRDSSTAMRTSRTAVLRSFLPVFYVLGVMQMFIGRFEVLTVVVLLTPSFWKA